MTVGRGLFFGLAVFRDQLWAVGGGEDGVGDSCEYLDGVTNTWIVGPAPNSTRSVHSLAVVNGQLWAIGTGSYQFFDTLTNTWDVGHMLSKYFDFTLPAVCVAIK